MMIPDTLFLACWPLSSQAHRSFEPNRQHFVFSPCWGVHTAMVAYLLGYDGRDKMKPDIYGWERISMRHTHTYTDCFCQMTRNAIFFED